MCGFVCMCECVRLGVCLCVCVSLVKLDVFHKKLKERVRAKVSSQFLTSQRGKTDIDQEFCPSSI